jgi:hypothetical protein
MLQSIPGPMIHDDDLLFLAIVPNWSRANRTTDTHKQRETAQNKRSAAEHKTTGPDLTQKQQNKSRTHPEKRKKTIYKIERNYDWK